MYNFKDRSIPLKSHLSFKSGNCQPRHQLTPLSKQLTAVLLRSIVTIYRLHSDTMRLMLWDVEIECFPCTTLSVARRFYSRPTLNCRATPVSRCPRVQSFSSRAIQGSERYKIYKITFGLCHSLREEVHKGIKQLRSAHKPVLGYG